MRSAFFFGRRYDGRMVDLCRLCMYVIYIVYIYIYIYIHSINIYIYIHSSHALYYGTHIHLYSYNTYIILHLFLLLDLHLGKQGEGQHHPVGVRKCWERLPIPMDFLNPLTMILWPSIWGYQTHPYLYVVWTVSCNRENIKLHVFFYAQAPTLDRDFTEIWRFIGFYVILVGLMTMIPGLNPVHKPYNMGASINRGTPVHHTFLDGIFPNKNHPASLGYLHLWKPPYTNGIVL